MAKRVFISRKEAAEAMGVHPQSISNYIERGFFKSKKHGNAVLIEKASFEEFLSVYSGSDIKESEDSIAELKMDIEHLRRDLEEEENLLHTKIGIMKARGTFCSMIHTGMLRDFVAALLDRKEEDNMCEREKYIISCVMDGTAIHRIAERLGLSSERVRVIFYKGIKKAIQKYYDAVDRIDRESALLEKTEKQHAHIVMLQSKVNKLEDLLEDSDIKKTYEEYKNDKDSEIGKLRWLKTTMALDFFYDEGASVRTCNVMKMYDFTMYQLVLLPKSEIKRYRNVGNKSINEMDEILERHGLFFGMRFDREIENLVDRFIV